MAVLGVLFNDVDEARAKTAQMARAVCPRPSCSVCVLLSSLRLAVNLAKELKYIGSSIVANKKEVPVLLHSCFCLIFYLLC